MARITRKNFYFVITIYMYQTIIITVNELSYHRVYILRPYHLSHCDKQSYVLTSQQFTTEYSLLTFI